MAPDLSGFKGMFTMLDVFKGTGGFLSNFPAFIMQTLILFFIMGFSFYILYMKFTHDY